MKPSVVEVYVCLYIGLADVFDPLLLHVSLYTYTQRLLRFTWQMILLVSHDLSLHTRGWKRSGMQAFISCIPCHDPVGVFVYLAKLVYRKVEFEGDIQKIFEKLQAAGIASLV